MKRRNLAGVLSACATLWLAGCSDNTTAPSQAVDPTRRPRSRPPPPRPRRWPPRSALLAAGQGITPLQRPAPVRPELSVLGRALAFDKVLSGNRDISCMTCHLTRAGDRRRPQRRHRPGGDRPRHRAGASAGQVHPPQRAAAVQPSRMVPLTWDGRVFRDAQGVIRTPGAPAPGGSAVRCSSSARSRRCRCSRCSPGRRCAARRATSWPPCPTASRSGPGSS